VKRPTKRPTQKLIAARKILIQNRKIDRKIGIGAPALRFSTPLYDFVRFNTLFERHAHPPATKQAFSSACSYRQPS
jgi:hypothetical protein